MLSLSRVFQGLFFFLLFSSFTKNSLRSNSLPFLMLCSGRSFNGEKSKSRNHVGCSLVESEIRRYRMEGGKEDCYGKRI